MEHHLVLVPKLRSEHHRGIERNAYQEDFDAPITKAEKLSKVDNTMISYQMIIFLSFIQRATYVIIKCTSLYVCGFTLQNQ